MSAISIVFSTFLLLVISYVALDVQNAMNSEHLREYSGIGYREFEVLEIDPPKHFDVTLLDKKTQFLHSSVGNSKHCSGFNRESRPKLHDIISVRVSYYTIKDSKDNTVYYQLDEKHLKSIFCD